MKWGLDNEKTALKAYESIKNVKVSECGFVINPKWPWLGCSPDGVLRNVVIEIKCPYSKRDMTVVEACSDKSFFCVLVDGKPKLKNNHSYFYQCQGVMAITEINKIDFIVYTKTDVHHETIEFDEQKWNMQWLPSLTAFYFEYMVPEIFKETE